METTVQRIPAALWESLQELCARQDQQFLQEVSRVLAIPVSELKRRVLGTRGVATTVIVQSSPWWYGSQCAAMEKKGALWMRCGATADADGQCRAHRRNITRYDDPEILALPTYQSIRIEGQTMWVDQEGRAYNEVGKILKDWVVDISNGHAYYGLCMDSGNPKKEETECAEA